MIKNSKKQSRSLQRRIHGKISLSNNISEFASRTTEEGNFIPIFWSYFFLFFEGRLLIFLYVRYPNNEQFLHPKVFCQIDLFSNE